LTARYAALHSDAVKNRRQDSKYAIEFAGSLSGGLLMYFVAALLAVLAGLFYAAGHHEIGSVGVEMCRYGSTFCESPIYVLVGAALAALWGAFVSVR
jgi:hypothetical protein